MSKKSRQGVFYLLFALTAGALWYFQSLIVVNVPFWDDFFGIIQPVYDLLADIPFRDKMIALFSQNNEHRVVNDRLFMLGVYLLTGNFDMRLLALLGFINLIGIVWILTKVFKKENLGLFFLLPILFFLFQPQYYESLQSLMVPFQNFSVIFYAFAAFYLVVYGKGYAYLAGFFFAALSFYTHGNGIFVIFIGAIILLVSGSRKQLLTWSVLGVLVVISYFYNYLKPDWSTSSSPLERPVEAFFYFFEFLGSFGLSYVETSTFLLYSSFRKIFPTIVGIIVFVCFAWIFFRIYPIRLNWNHLKQQFFKLRASRFEVFMLACLLFFLFTGVILALHRTGFPMMSRYTINSALFVSLVYIYGYYHLADRAKVIWFRVFAVTGITFMLLGYYNSWDIAVYKRKLAITDGINWKKNHIWSNQYFDSQHTENLKDLLNNVYEEKMYFIPVTILDKIDSVQFENQTAAFEVDEDGLLLSFVDHEDRRVHLDPEEGIYYVLKNDTHEFILPAFHMKNGFTKFLTTGRYNSGIVKTGFTSHLFPNGEYEVIKIEKHGNTLKKYRTGKTIVNTKYKADRQAAG